MIFAKCCWLDYKTFLDSSTFGRHSSVCGSVPFCRWHRHVTTIICIQNCPIHTDSRLLCSDTWYLSNHWSVLYSLYWHLLHRHVFSDSKCDTCLHCCVHSTGRHGLCVLTLFSSVTLWRGLTYNATALEFKNLRWDLLNG